MASTLKVDTIAHTGGTTGMTIDSNGFVFDKRPHFVARATSNQSVVQSTYVNMNIDQAVNDTHNFVDLSNNRIVFTAATAGVYHMTWGCKFNSIAANRIGLWPRRAGAINTGTYMGYFESSGTGASYQMHTYSLMYNFTASDFFTIDFYHNASGSIDTYAIQQDLGQFICGFRVG